MSSGGRVASSRDCATRPKAQEIGLTGYAAPTPRSLHIGHYVMATAEHREPCDSRGSCTVLGAPGGEIPPGDSTLADNPRTRVDVHAALLLLMLEAVTTFHHQPEAQHLKSSAIHKLGTADYPISTPGSGHPSRAPSCPLRARRRPIGQLSIEKP